MTDAAPLALWLDFYAKRGWSLIRLAPNSKVPIDPGWQSSPAPSLDGHDGSIGWPVPLGRVVLDFDRKNGVDCLATRAELEAELGPLPPTLTQTTPRGGRHEVCALPRGANARNAVAAAPSIDVRAYGGQIGRSSFARHRSAASITTGSILRRRSQRCPRRGVHGSRSGRRHLRRRPSKARHAISPTACAMTLGPRC